MSGYLITPDGRKWIPESTHPPIGDLPVPIDFIPSGSRYSAETPGRFGRVPHDDIVYGYARTKDKPISFTNEIQPLREYKLKDGSYRVFPVSKCIVDVNGTEWLDWLIDLMGQDVYDRFKVHGYGFMDTGEGKLAALPCGGNLLYEYGTVVQGGTKWSLIATMDFNDALNRELTWKNAPHLFIKQYLVFNTSKYNIGWTVDKGEVGGNGDIVFPIVSKTEAAIESNLLEFYRKPPFNTIMYNQSVIEEYIDSEGITRLREKELNGTPMTIEELCFSGSNTYARAGINWYLVEEMLVRGDYNDKAKGGNWLDFRKYWSEERRAHPVAEIGWILSL